MDEIGLAEAIEAVRQELVQAVLAGAGRPVQFPVHGVQLTFQVGVTRDATSGGKLSFRVMEFGRERHHQEQSVHTVSVNLGAPLDTAGEHYKVVELSDEKP